MRVGIVVDHDGCLTSCVSQGHSGSGTRGNDIVCAAVTVLVRTVAETLGGGKGIRLDWIAPERGDFRFDVDDDGGFPRNKDWERGIADCLSSGLERLARDYPDHLEVNIQHK